MLSGTAERRHANGGSFTARGQPQQVGAALGARWIDAHRPASAPVTARVCNGSPGASPRLDTARRRPAYVSYKGTKLFYLQYCPRTELLNKPRPLQTCEKHCCIAKSWQGCS